MAHDPERHAEFYLPCSDLTALPFAGQESKFKELEAEAIDGVEVQRRAYEFSSEQIVHLGSCGEQSNPTREIEDKYYGRHASVVRGFLTYEVRGRTVAYRFTCFAVMVRAGHITERFGAAGTIYYVAKDRDGTFTRVFPSHPLQFLPKWVKKLAAEP
jgi:hypothetical protein